MQVELAASELISVVIPTRNRPTIVNRSVQSALSQSWSGIEVVVVIDGPDDKTVEALAQIKDPRLKVVCLAQSGGAQEARNAGVRAASGKWIAFLDDDDEWRKDKLALQLDAARRCGSRKPIVSCGIVELCPEGNFEWPRRAPRPSESIAEYLFLRDLAEMREIRLQTSTLLMPKALLIEVPWRKGPNDEWDLLLRAAAVDGVGLAFVAGPLVLWHSDAGAERLSRTGRTWRDNMAWFRSVRDLVGPRPYASFLLSTLSTWARNERDWPAFVGLPVEAIRHGHPTVSSVATHAGRWLIPQQLRILLK